jgi:pSer/pThr/pTyr-binding forkhead associated (FHA) protein
MLDDDTTSGVSTTSDEGAAGGEHHQYLLVFDAASSYMFPLPAAGEIEVGRQSANGLKLADTAASRRHAKLVIDGHVTLVDLGSQNGTRINGERVVGSRRLHSADMITIGGATLVYHSDRRDEVISSPSRRLRRAPSL